MLSESAYYVIPFLIELACTKLCGDVVYDLLLSILACTDPDTNEEQIAVGGVTVSLRQACRQRVAEGMDCYLDTVQEQSLSLVCRTSAISVVCSLLECQDRWLPVLSRIVQTDPNMNVRRAIEDWLS